MRFVVIRHAQSANNLLYERTGASVGRHHDPELTDLGRTQAARLADAVAEGALPWQITHLHTSLMTRAVQTAAPLADALNLPLLGNLDAYETDGVFIANEDGTPVPHPGATADALQAVSARLVLPVGVGPDGWYTRPYEHEYEVHAERARALISSLRHQHDDGDVVALLTHGAFFQHLFRALLGIEQMSGWVLKHNTAISLFADAAVTDYSTVTALRVDWMPHLSDDLVSE
ncbi:Phosphoglycerate mutase [Beutenbergia cavernae DSM 12333]|uniref:Phosphoglycerate mutase n=1 Tax=Beutenbergia cavernae (strain ATCC BAA-8 / DSM 12333 / CCUG 43141 / JCM 11478 / NBRC 16432 / NCIMB 13614 / HKI 0122) TaxID=471853 RepID=C5C3J7_BEUC1|nr:histidine phosphatase family protein [Beutenbergia cavernae]ACQ81906.1 Phosphoglycerate mutase [Beutenbergia cavernae DSM 12333]